MEMKRRFNSTLASKQKSKKTRSSLIAQSMTRKYGGSIIELTQTVTIRPIEVSPFATLESKSDNKRSMFLSKIIKELK